MSDISKSQLREMYVEKGRTCSEISEECNLSHSTIHRKLKKYDIERRDSGPRPMFGDEKYHQISWLREKFHGEGLSYTEIANVCGVSKQTIYKSAKRVGLDTNRDTRYRDHDWFYEEYIEKDKTLKEISNKCGVSRVTIQDWRKKHNIPKQYPTGKNNPNTKPNDQCVTRERGQDWHKKRKMALERSDYACENPMCEEDSNSLGKNPDVHHIVPYRFHEEVEDINDLSNLIVLCRKCHNKVEPHQCIYN